MLEVCVLLTSGGFLLSLQSSQMWLQVQQSELASVHTQLLNQRD